MDTMAARERIDREAAPFGAGSSWLNRLPHAWWLLALATMFVALGHYRHLSAVPTDFRAFYSAGTAVRLHADPYRVQPLLGIEQRFANAGERVDVVTPAPLPLYALALFSQFSRIPLHVAVLLFELAILAATFVIGYCMSRLCPLPLPLPIAIAVAYYGFIYEGAVLGQIAPFAIAGIAVATLLLRRDRPIAAAIALSVSLLQPQFGTSVILCALLFVPQMRIALLACCAVLLAVSLSFGIRENLEYAQVLRLQALAEITFEGQYSLAWILRFLGAGANTALLVGSLSTVAALIGTAVFLGRYRIEALRTGAVLLLPAATAVLGGSFLHCFQLVVALLAAVIVVPFGRTRYNPGIAAAIFVMPFAIAFESAGRLEPQTLVPCVVGIVTTCSLLLNFSVRDTARGRVFDALLLTAALCAAFVAYLVMLPDSVTTLPNYHPLIPGDALAPVAWGDYAERLHDVNASHGILIFAAKCKFWVALILTVVLSVRAIRAVASGGTSGDAIRLGTAMRTGANAA